VKNSELGSDAYNPNKIKVLIDEAVLASQKVMPTKLIDSGFEFLDPEVGPALEAVV
jgi:NAD dependent epimerase/dehydratase family enzyme